MRFPTQKRKPRKTNLASFPVPSAGLIGNRNLAIPSDKGQAPGAVMLTNFFPTASGVILRRGMSRKATITGGRTVESMFAYSLGPQQRLFAADSLGIWDVTSGTPISILTGKTNGNWTVLQFATAGTNYLIGVNGVDTGFIYDGTNFWPYIAGGIMQLGVAAVPVGWVAGTTITGGTSGATATVLSTATGILYLTGVTGVFTLAETLTGSVAGSTTVTVVAFIKTPGVTGLASSDMSYIWAYKNRLFFAKKGTLDAYYLPVSQVGGTAVLLPLGGVFRRGGALLFGQNWSLDTGGDGGLAEQCTFTTTEGEVAAFQGANPDDANDWGKVGVYYIGKPLGKSAFIRAGGDLVIATTLGFIPLGQAIRRDYAALGQVAVSNPIADDWSNAIEDFGAENWQAVIWGEGKMALVVPQQALGVAPLVLVSNTDTGAWCKFEGWTPTAMTTFNGQLYMGSVNGAVQLASDTGADEGMPYTGTAMPLFADFGAGGNRKIADFARVVTRGLFLSNGAVTARFDWDLSQPSVPDAANVNPGGIWDQSLWDVGVWGPLRQGIIQEHWFSVGGSGYAVSVIYQVTSANFFPIDEEIVRMEISLVQGDIVT